MYRTYRGMMATQWLDRNHVRQLQERRLRRIIRRAHESVPYYRELLDEARVIPDTFRGLADLERIPITTKSDLQKLPVECITDRIARQRGLSRELSSGSTGQPFVTVCDAGARRIRSSMFFRALRATGYRLGDKLLLVTDRKPRILSREVLRWRYASIEDAPERLRTDFLRFAPNYVYGCVTPLRLLAEEIASTRVSVRPLAGVITTAETLDQATRSLLADTFQCAVFEFYGLSEMGVVGYECEEHDGLHLADDSVIVEQIPLGATGDPSRLVMTNLYSAAMPFIRFDSGDLGSLDLDVTCGCGRTFTVLKRLEGRAVDCVLLKGGHRLSPYRLTCRLERVRGVKRYQVIQNDLSAFTVRIEADERRTDVNYEDIRQAIRAVAGHDAAVEIEIVENVSATSSRKFRIVRSQLPHRQES